MQGLCATLQRVPVCSTLPLQGKRGGSEGDSALLPSRDLCGESEVQVRDLALLTRGTPYDINQQLRRLRRAPCCLGWEPAGVRARRPAVARSGRFALRRAFRPLPFAEGSSGGGGLAEATSPPTDGTSNCSILPVLVHRLKANLPLLTAPCQEVGLLALRRPGQHKEHAVTCVTLPRRHAG